MKNIYFALIMVMIPLFGLAQGITFEEGTFQEALDKAKTENKLLFIDGYAVWCVPCKHMDKTVFLEERVGQFFDQHMIAIKVDVERGEGPALKAKYGIEGLPGYVVLDGDGEVVYRFEAAMPTEDFMKEVSLALEYSKDMESLGRLAERFESEKENESFLATYLSRLHQSKSTNYYDVLEQFLKVQTSLDPASKEMVLLLARHSGQIILGGKADEIIRNNYGSDSWKRYVRKDIRATYQNLLGRGVITNTLNYAVVKRDTSMIEMAFVRTNEMGFPVTEEQRKQTYQEYFLKTGQGSKYKDLVRDDIQKYAEGIDVAYLRDYYLQWQKLKAAGDEEASYIIPKALKVSGILASRVKTYAQFIGTEEEKKQVLQWMKIAFEMVPGHPHMMNDYATFLYLFGNDKEKALNLKEEAYKILLAQDSKKVEVILLDLEAMRNNQRIQLL